MRAFLAVPADAGWVQSARELVASLQPALPRASWTRPESWHLTLKFLGEVSEAAVEGFAAAIGPRVAGMAGGEIGGARAAVFPRRGRARVLSVGFAPGVTAEALELLAAEADAAGRKVGVAPEERPFHPHVTLARIREPWPPAAVSSFVRRVDEWSFPVWRVRSGVLYESRLDPAGAVHRPVREWEMSATVAEARP